MKAGGIRELEAKCMPTGTDSAEKAILTFLLAGNVSSALLTFCIRGGRKRCRDFE